MALGYVTHQQVLSYSITTGNLLILIGITGSPDNATQEGYYNLSTNDYLAFVGINDNYLTPHSFGIAVSSSLLRTFYPSNTKSEPPVEIESATLETRAKHASNSSTDSP